MTMTTFNSSNLTRFTVYRKKMFEGLAFIYAEKMEYEDGFIMFSIGGYRTASFDELGVREIESEIYDYDKHKFITSLVWSHVTVPTELEARWAL